MAVNLFTGIVLKAETCMKKKRKEEEGEGKGEEEIMKTSDSKFCIYTINIRVLEI